ncbi:CapA family protein [Elongatibacter sediminis]|uniref:CapA family protein n=1 Tax=Elongatibacter sediminis TaxID=3119006 RepID=A0AAW9RIH9_9GAMM
MRSDPPEPVSPTRRALLAGTLALAAGLAPHRSVHPARPEDVSSAPGEQPLTLFLAGDVMTGRGLDQALPYSVDPRLYEARAQSALHYLRLAEEANGSLPLPLDFAWPWGDALAVLDEVRPALRWVNLETTITNRGAPDPGKEVHYRMHPGNVACLAAAGIDGVSLANNHALDWGEVGLEDTRRSLEEAGIAFAGAGPDRAAAMTPVIYPTPAGRLLVFAACTGYSGVPRGWSAGPSRPGVHRINLAPPSIRALADAVSAVRQPGDRVVLSLHWGGNWGYAVHEDQRQFAHQLIDEVGIDLVHGHSSHHPRGIEWYRGRAILYGCGDFLNDYEGIRSERAVFRSDLTAMYFPTLEPSGALRSLELVPMRIRRFRLQQPPAEEVAWLQAVLDRESRKLGTRVLPSDEGRFRVVPA